MQNEPGAAPAPEDNQPGHHPDVEQDKPDLDRFAERLGVTDEVESTTDDGDGDAEGESGMKPQFKAAAAKAKDFAEPIAAAVQHGVQRAAEAIDQQRGLADRVEKLEREVEELRARLDALS